MTTRNTSPSRGAAARSEVNGKVKTISLSDPLFKGIKLTAPSVLPATAAWDIAEIQQMQKRGQNYIGGLLQMIVTVVGAEQAERVRDRLAEKAPVTTDGGLELLDQVASDIIDSYGTTAGE